ncbi:MAG TPA: histidine kinase dimerization/phospho-acceptor domain-containing protein [Rhodanobacteraceae bacterium]|nr:histidine kinase dimerization/phospho-acceptor domain-containing protein [Rhodanobacteraceae bacterium]
MFSSSGRVGRWLNVSLARRLLVVQMTGLLLLLGGLFFMLDWSIDYQIYGRMDGDLLDHARSYALLVSTGHADELPARESANPGMHTREWVRVLAPDARRGIATANRPDLAPPRAVTAGQPLFYDVPLHPGRARAVALVLGTHGLPRMLVVAEDLSAKDWLEHRLHFALWVGVVLASALGALLAVASVRRGLRPLDAFSAAVARLDPEQLPQVLSAPPLPLELVPLRRALDAALARVAAALQRERRFSRDVAHELRTPLAEIRIAAELAEREAAPPARAAFAAVLQSAERLQRTIDSLLALTRYEAGLAQPQPEPLDLAVLLAQRVALASRLGAARDVRFDVAQAGERWALSDPALLERILDNLLQNAATYAAPHSTVQLGFGAAAAPLLQIRNAAPDLEAADLVHLGERFWRKSPARESDVHGGLGLALARTLASVLGLELRFALAEGALTVNLGPFRGLSES